MFEDIEKNFRKCFRFRYLNWFYWGLAFILICCKVIFKFGAFYVYIILLLGVIIYMLFDYIRVIGLKSALVIKNTGKNILMYDEIITSKRKNTLIILLKESGFKTKNDIKMALDYYNYCRPIKTETGVWGLVISATLTIASFVEFAYDAQTKNIDSDKMIAIFSNTFEIEMMILILIFMFMTIIKTIYIPKKEVQSQLFDDLLYIYLNFDKYK